MNKRVGTADQWERGTVTRKPICCPGVVKLVYLVQAWLNLWDLILEPPSHYSMGRSSGYKQWADISRDLTFATLWPAYPDPSYSWVKVGLNTPIIFSSFSIFLRIHYLAGYAKSNQCLNHGCIYQIHKLGWRQLPWHFFWIHFSFSVLQLLCVMIAHMLIGWQWWNIECRDKFFMKADGLVW